MLKDTEQVMDKGIVAVAATIPSDVMVLVLGHSWRGAVEELSEVCDMLLSNNQTHDGVFMVHQKIKQPNVISKCKAIAKYSDF